MNVYQTPRLEGKSSRLSKRQLEVLMWLAEGKTFKETGQILKIEGGTAAKHYDKVSEKVEAGSTRQSVITQALVLGIISLKRGVAA